MGTFQAGQLWLQDDIHGTVQLSHPQTGEIVWGVQVSTRDRGFSFCPSVLHGTMPWTGDRWAVTAFTPRGLHKLEVSDQRQLLHWGFPWSASASVPQDSSTVRSRQALLSSPAAETVSRRVELSEAVTVKAQQNDWLASREELPQRLAAARPVTWRGSGDLLQLPAVSAPQGTWLVIDLWAGYSGLCIALLALGVAFYGIAAESDPEARACARHSMPALVHVADVSGCISTPPIAAQEAVARSDCRRWLTHVSLTPA